MSIAGPPAPTFSPMYSIGASSISPSPITTVPSMATLSKAVRMASTAAPSASFFLPRPIQREAAMRRGLGDADEFQREVAVGHLAGVARLGCVHGRSSGTGSILPGT